MVPESHYDNAARLLVNEVMQVRPLLGLPSTYSWLISVAQKQKDNTRDEKWGIKR